MTLRTQHSTFWRRYRKRRATFVRLRFAFAFDLSADSSIPPASMDDRECSTRNVHFAGSANIAKTQPWRWKRLKLRSSSYARISGP